MGARDQPNLIKKKTNKQTKKILQLSRQRTFIAITLKHPGESISDQYRYKKDPHFFENNFRFQSSY